MCVCVFVCLATCPSHVDSDPDQHISPKDTYPRVPRYTSPCVAAQPQVRLLRLYTHTHIALFYHCSSALARSCHAMRAGCPSTPSHGQPSLCPSLKFAPTRTDYSSQQNVLAHRGKHRCGRGHHHHQQERPSRPASFLDPRQTEPILWQMGSFLTCRKV